MTDYTALIEPALFRTLPEQGPRAHLYDLLEGFLRRGGKRIRPTICLAACEAFGGRSVDALEVAAGLELFHCAFLVHDDIEDESDQRRGEPTMHRRFGVARALMKCDFILVQAMR